MILTQHELVELTGYLQPGKQNEWLRLQGFTFRVAADGRPRVDRSHYLKLMGGGSNESMRTKTQPNFCSLENSLSK